MKLEPKLPFDKYTMSARVAPALIVILPPVLGIIAWVTKTELLQTIGSIVIGLGATALLSHLSRTAGKRAERSLLSRWGGWPSTILLRHRDTTINPIDKKRYHDALAKLVPGITLPTQEDEEADPKAADHVYEACCTWLKAQTVNEHKFERLFAENMSYGFRRNLYGMRKMAIIFAIVGFLACVGKIWFDTKGHMSLSATAIVCGAIDAAVVFIFITVLTENFVREAGYDYAIRLLAAIDELSKEKPKSTKTKKDKAAKEE